MTANLTAPARAGVWKLPGRNEETRFKSNKETEAEKSTCREFSA